MATFFLDFEGGNDANDGTTFANRWKTMTNGATAARIAPGDTIRLMGSPAPTSLGNATWTRVLRDTAMPATTTVSSITNATPIVVTTSAAHGLATGDVVQITGQTNAANRYINGVWEVVVLTTTTFELVGSVGTGSTTLSGTTTVRNYNAKTIKLATDCTKTIDMCEVLWTGAANVTVALTTTNKQGDSAMSLSIAAGFTTGKVAHFALPATLDLSGYKQLSFWIRTNTSFAGGVFSLRLCSDASGNTTVDTVNIPAITGVNSYVPVTVNLGAALGSSIASIALYADTDPGTVIVLIDSIIACKDSTSADSLSLVSLIGKNTAGETWYPIAVIAGKVVALDCGAAWSSGPNTHRGYWGTTETVTTYKREPIQLAMVASGDIGLTMNDSGSAGSPITYSGGWNRTDMSTQNGFTWVDCRNCLPLGVTWGFGRAYNDLSKMGVTRAVVGFGSNAGGTTLANGNFSDVAAVGCNTGFLQVSSSGLTDVSFSGAYFNNNSSSGLSLGGACKRVTGTIDQCNCNGGSTLGVTVKGLLIAGRDFELTVISLCGNYAIGVSFESGACNNHILAVTNISDNGGASLGSAICLVSGTENCIHSVANCDRNDAVFGFGVINNTSQGGEVTVYNITSTDNALLAVSSNSAIVGAGSGQIRVLAWNSTDLGVSNFASVIGEHRLRVDRWGGADDAQRVYGPGFEIRSETSVRHTASGLAWRLNPTSTTIRVAQSPVTLPVAHIACEANKLVTVKAWLRRSHTDLTVGIKCARDQLAGIATDQSATISAAADTWEEVTITFTPTEAGVVEIEAFAYGGTTNYGYIDDMTLTQAA